MGKGEVRVAAIADCKRELKSWPDSSSHKNVWTEFSGIYALYVNAHSIYCMYYMHHMKVWPCLSWVWSWVYWSYFNQLKYISALNLWRGATDFLVCGNTLDLDGFLHCAS